MRRFSKLGAVGLAVVLLLSMTAPAFAAAVDPRAPYEGETRLPGSGGDTWTFVNCDLQFKAEDGSVEPGEWTTDGITVRVYTAGGKTVFDFESATEKIMKVAVKGGSATYPTTDPIPWGVVGGAVEGQWVYDYTSMGGVSSDTGLRAPNNDAGNQANLSNLVFCFKHEEPPVLRGSISALKWYDRDKDGQVDSNEPWLEGWKIMLTDGQAEWCALTNADGVANFSNLPTGTYYLSEAAPPLGSGWLQTFPAGNRYVIELAAGETKGGYRFGNVCERTSSGGHTLGYWSNNNGGASLSAYNRTRGGSAWQTFLNRYNLVGRTGGDFDATSHFAFRTWLLKADATNMSYMLSAQMAATLLNVEVMGTSYAGLGVIVDGEWRSTADVVQMANVFLGGNRVTTASGPARSTAEFYKNIFDNLNNNRQTVIPYDPCPVPAFSCD